MGHVELGKKYFYLVEHKWIPSKRRFHFKLIYMVLKPSGKIKKKLSTRGRC